MRKKSDRGFGLMELAIVCGIIGLMFGSVWALSGTTGDTARRAVLKEQIVMIVRNVRSFYLGAAGLSTSLSSSCFTSCAIVEGLAPREMVRTFETDGAACKGSGSCAGILDHPWGLNASTSSSGGVQLAVTTSSTQQFMIKMYGLTGGNCVWMSEQLTSSLGPTGLLALLINSATQTLPLSVKTAMTQCGTGTTAEVDAVYRLRTPQVPN